MVIGPSAPFTRLLLKNAPANTTPLLVGDFLRVDHPLRPAEILKGLCRMTNPCGVSHGQMAKVELLETVWKIARGLLGCGYGWCPVSKNSASWPLVANLQSSS